MIRKITAILALLLSISLLNVSADEGHTYLSGTVKTNIGNLLFTTFSVSGKDFESVKGTITYDKNVLAFYKVDILSTNNWDYEFDTKKAGTISFSAEISDASVASSLINSQTELFKVTFAVIAYDSTETTLNAKSCKATYTVTETQTVEDKDNIINQELIDLGLATDPIYGTKEVQVAVEKTVDLPGTSQKVVITNVLSNDAYLKALSSDVGVLSPEFNKATNTYRLTITPDQDFAISCTVEDPKSSYTIEPEANNQVIINVKAEDGSTNAYVVTIIRQTNYDNQGNQNNPPTPINPVDPVNKPVIRNNIGLSPAELAISAALAVVAIAGFVIGGKMIYEGSHNR